MVVVPAQLASELKGLRKGRGVYSADLASRAGPALREVCGIVDDDGPAMIREKLVDRLDDLAKKLPEELGVAVVASIAVHPDARQLLLQDRVQWLAAYLRRDLRTARRRIDEGIERLAEVAAAPPGRAPQVPEQAADGWYIEEFSALLRMDQASPEAIERRRIVAERTGLDEIGLAMTLPRDHGDVTDSHDIFVEVLYGGRLMRKSQESDSRFRFVLELPTPLRVGDRHEYALLLRLPADQPMRSHYVFTPARRCDLFDLRVRFDQSRLPQRLWLVTAAFHREVDEAQPTATILTVDKAGEIHVQFHKLAPGFGYGVQWLP